MKLGLGFAGAGLWSSLLLFVVRPRSLVRATIGVPRPLRMRRTKVSSMGDLEPTVLEEYAAKLGYGYFR